MNSLGQYNSRKMEFQSKRKVHPCLDYHIPILPIFIKQEFYSITQGGLDWQGSKIPQ